jgi:cell division protease FtsH
VYEAFVTRLEVLLAGRTAEEVLLGSASHGAVGAAGSDLDQATTVAAATVASFSLTGPHPLLYLGPLNRTEDLLSYADVRHAANVELAKAADGCRKLLESRLGGCRGAASAHGPYRWSGGAVLA